MADSFKIDKGVPMPPPIAKYRKYPFAALEIGDSFFVPAADERSRNTALQAANSHGRRSGRRITGRTVTEDGVRGVRLWRVE